MNRMICALMAAAIGGSFVLAPAIPAGAAIVFPLQPQIDTSIQTVAHNGPRRHRPPHAHRNFNRHPGGYHRRHYRPNAHYRGRPGYWHGHRGYRNYRPGYRYYDGFWYPAAAFVGGAILGSAIANQPTYYAQPSYGNAHVQWCYNRYRSYRASDNTFQPNSGPRRPCVSPY